ncbi:phasin family protein [Sphingomonas sp. ID1715]|uniref:phasin family protein n=1 Tax=Sphingomonas sp. ID1715 TaxID=1656898 RepID=UPI0014879948|nr:phasin family protein [Sphingomonas sp. ID1715]NNM78125.1 phasin family protein [Sphingomonas sp. ID1715]
MSTKVVKTGTKAPAKKIAPAATAEPAMTAPAAIAAATVEAVAEPIVAQPVIEPAIAESTPTVQPVATETKGPTMTDTVNTTAEQTKNFAQDAQARATAMFADVNTRAKAAMERSTKLFEELNEFNKGNIEAIVESSKVAAKVAEQMGQNAAETARKNFEQATAALKSFAAAKTPTEFFQLQSEFARSAFDQLIAETSKNSETALKLAGDIFQPISNRFAVAAEKFKHAA